MGRTKNRINIDPDRRYRCDGCGLWFEMADVEPVIGHIHERVDEGGPMPSGECRKCGALVYKFTQQDEYVLLKGQRCPYCASSDIAALAVSSDCVESGEFRQEVECHSCDRRWHDVYKLSGYEEQQGVAEQRSVVRAAITSINDALSAEPHRDWRDSLADAADALRTLLPDLRKERDGHKT